MVKKISKFVVASHSTDAKMYKVRIKPIKGQYTPWRMGVIIYLVKALSVAQARREAINQAKKDYVEYKVFYRYTRSIVTRIK